MMMKQWITIFSISTLMMMNTLIAQVSVDKIEPPHWYTHMYNPQLQLMVHGRDIASLTPKIDYKGVTLQKINKVKNPNYLFLDLEITSAAEAGKIEIEFWEEEKLILKQYYSLLDRRVGSADRKGFGSEDVIYLITPDRFANGDPSNDHVDGMLEGLDRSKEHGRHGGDLRGISEHLDYIQDMGFTSIWLNPILQNNQDSWSYHGYATTDYYQVDPRFGSNQDYVTLTQKAKSMGIGMIMDIISNHCGSNHWWMKDPPTDDWINYQNSSYQGTNHRRTTVLDPYVSSQDRELMTQGWFVPTMPDLNQRNSFMATYLIQNSIWWIEYADLAGIRQDTYSYPDKEFMADWSCAIMNEYPNFNIVGEEWSLNPNIISYWQKDKSNNDGYTSCLPSLMDFPMCMTLQEALKNDEAWNKGWIELYEMLGNDHIYPHADELVIFPDNHDMSRIYTVLAEDYDLLRMAITYILTMRGTPQIYYGTEILMSHPGTDSHGAIREDFPGGWKNDTSNGFTGSNMDRKALEAQEWIKNLLNWRKSANVIHQGKLMHFAPQDGVYVYFRYDNDQTVMVIFNKNKEAFSLNMSRFESLIKGNKTAENILDQSNVSLQGNLTLSPRSTYVLTF